MTARTLACLCLALAGCFANEPPPTCRVVATQDGARQPPYVAKLTRVARSSDCTDAQILSVMRIGVEVYQTPGSSDAPTLLLRPARMVDLAQGRVFSVNGRPVPRVDSSDPEGRNLNATAPLSTTPSGGVCTTSRVAISQQRFDATMVQVPDGGTTSFPELFARMDFSDVRVVTTAEVPGTAFTAKLAHTEGNCAASYDVLAVYPAVACTKDDDCASTIDADAGRLTVSGINPAFDAACDLAIGHCMPRVDVTKAGLPKL